MTVLRSREVVSIVQKEQSHKPLKSGDDIQPLTPAKDVELTSKSSYEATPSPNKLLRISDKLGSVVSSDSGSMSNQGLRRSSRLSLKSSSHNTAENVGTRKRRKLVDCENAEEADRINGLGIFVEGGNEKESADFDSAASHVRVSRESDAANSCEANGVLVSDLGEKEEGRSLKKASCQSVPTIDAQLLDSELVGDVGIRGLKLRSGKKLVKSVFKQVANDRKRRYGKEDEIEAEEAEVDAGANMVGKQSSAVEAEEGSRGNINFSENTWRKFNIEDKKKGVLIDGGDRDESCVDKKIKIRAGEESERISKTKVDEEIENDVNDTIKMDINRLGVEEKGKGISVKVDSSSICSDMDDFYAKTDVGSTMDKTIADTVSLEQTTIERAGLSTKRDHKEMFKNVARENASRFAYFSAQEEEKDPALDEVEVEPSEPVVNGDVEDWPGPFSTALKIIKDRAANIAAQQTNLTSEKSHSVLLTWVPKQNQCARVMKVAPSLQDICMKIMAENVGAITSLESVPDVLRHKLTQLLCDCRKMDNHFLDLLASGLPAEIRIRDCSWLDEEQLMKMLERTDTSNLTVLQLDQCGRCLPDYVLSTTLAPFPSKLSALTNISLKGACRISDAGLRTLVASVPALRSINLGCCSLLTSDGIVNLADKLGPVLKELYIDECFGVDAMRILPALLKLEQLEVLSISRIETVTDSFIRRFVAVRGQNMKELILADCTQLTDKAFKAIAESCPGLCAIDVTNLCKLSDNAIGYLANSCQAIQTMKLCRNAFSDEAVAAYLEASGKPLKELWLNHVDKVANDTALSVAKHARNLHSLDLSWCRNMTDEAVGLIVDSCLSLKMLKLFGCTQITNVFIDGHSNETVKIVGLRGSELLKNVETADLLPLRYSSLV